MAKQGCCSKSTHEAEIKYIPRARKDDTGGDSARTSNINLLEKSDNIKFFQKNPSVQLQSTTSSTTKLPSKDVVPPDPKYISLPDVPQEVKVYR